MGKLVPTVDKTTNTINFGDLGKHYSKSLKEATTFGLADRKKVAKHDVGYFNDIAIAGAQSAADSGSDMPVNVRVDSPFDNTVHSHTISTNDDDAVSVITIVETPLESYEELHSKIIAVMSEDQE